jgi:hypothetical protein
VLTVIANFPGTNLVAVFLSLVELDVELRMSVSVLKLSFLIFAYPFVQSLRIGTLCIGRLKVKPRVKDYQSRFGVKVLAKKLSAELDGPTFNEAYLNYLVQASYLGGRV